jgi:signal transduction histidine kinase/CheY-like chemotaxis protein
MDDPVLVLAPRGRDAAVAVEVLERHQIPAVICKSLGDLAQLLHEGSGVALVTEESLQGEDLDAVLDQLARQPPWSDYPFVVLANGYKGTRSARAFETLDQLRNVVLLERPLHAEALVRAVRSALNARRRQYEARDVLARSREELEQLVVERTREREQALAQLHEAQKLETIGQLTGGVAHDFNNLLTPVMGNLDMLRRRLPDEDLRSRRLVENALQAVSRAATLVQRLLAFARRQDLQPRKVDVCDLLLGIEDLLARSIGPTIEVVIEAAGHTSVAMVDAGQLELAILNLAINARDAMPSGGKLTIAVSERMLHDAASSGLKAGRYICVAVTDTGVGMDAKTLTRAVEPFFSTKGQGKGTGLGLSMVHGLAAQSGGALHLFSKPGEGTRAELCLPAAEGAAASKDAREPERIPITREAAILLVDDDELARVATAEILGDLGYCVITAASGAEALSRLDGDGVMIDLLVTDYLMPGMTGAELARETRRLHPELPVLLITGYTNLTEPPGMDLPRLAKPFRQVDLARRIAALLGVTSLDVAAQAKPVTDPL